MFDNRYTITTTVAISAKSMKEAVEVADAIYDEVAEYGPSHVLIEHPPGETPDPDGVFCEGCKGHTISGVRWPTATNGDKSREWVERCDTCQRHPSDEAAAQAVVDTYGDPKVARIGFGIPVGLDSTYVFIDGEVSGERGSSS